MTIHPAVKEFLTEAGRKGGSSTSEKKQKASKKNGRLGGRPKGKKNKK